jgi:hypothetical protein
MIQPRLMQWGGLALVLATGTGPLNAAESTASTGPLRILLVTGGCCHNYKLQAESLTNAFARQAPAQWTVVHAGGNGTRAEIPLYQNADWARGFDVVVHNECFADTTSPENHVGAQGGRAGRGHSLRDAHVSGRGDR